MYSWNITSPGCVFFPQARKNAFDRAIDFNLPTEKKKEEEEGGEQEAAVTKCTVEV